MLNIAFCDDDSDFLSMIVNDTQKILIDLKIDNRIYTYTDGNRIIADFKGYQPYFDIVFLDIIMPVINGKEVARKLRTLDKKFKLVFITAREEEVLDTLQYNISGFIPKKQINENLPGIMSRLVNMIAEENPHLCIFTVEINHARKMIIKVPLNDILFIECINRTLFLYTKRTRFTLHGHRLSEVMEQYIPLGFVQIHRTCIVNVRYISCIDDMEVCLDNGVHLPISRRKKQMILNSFWGYTGLK